MSAIQQPIPWLTVNEFVVLSGMPLRTVWNRIKAGDVPSRKDGKLRKISAAALPEAARIKLAPVAPSKEVTRPTEPACAPAPLFDQMERWQPGRRILLSPQQERQAIERLKALQPLLDFIEDPAKRAQARAFPLPPKHPGGAPRTVRDSNDMAEYLVRTHAGGPLKLSVPTIWRWKKRYEDEGLPGLARKVREDKGRVKWAEQYPAAAQLLRVVWLQPFQTKQEAYDVLCRDHRSVGMERHEIPSYASVCDYLASLPAAPTVLAREGEKAHHDKMSGHISRAYTDLATNDVWVSDTMLHDVWVWNDCFNARGGEAIRVQLVAIMDMRSRFFVGKRWMLNGSSRGITSAFVEAARKYGAPRSFYCDNGADYKRFAKFARPLNAERNVAEDVKALHESGALRQLDIPVTFCIPFSPWSKPVERAFRTLHIKSDAVHRHYTTGNAYLKPDATIAAGELHNKLLKAGRVEDSPLLPASHFIRMAQDWIELDYNANHKHSGRGMDGRTPEQVFRSHLPSEGFRHCDPAILDTLLWGRSKVLVRRTEIQLNRRAMVGATEIDAAALYLLNDEEVTVCYDEHHPETAVVADADGRKICDLRAKDYAPQSPAAKPMIEASMRLHRTLRNAAAQTIRGDRKAIAELGVKSTAQLMNERALLPRAVGDSIVQPAELKATGTYGPTHQMHSEDIGDALAASLAGGTYGA